MRAGQYLRDILVPSLGIQRVKVRDTIKPKEISKKIHLRNF